MLFTTREKQKTRPRGKKFSVGAQWTTRAFKNSSDVDAAAIYAPEAAVHPAPELGERRRRARHLGAQLHLPVVALRFSSYIFSYF